MSSLRTCSSESRPHDRELAIERRRTVKTFVGSKRLIDGDDQRVAVLRSGEGDGALDLMRVVRDADRWLRVWVARGEIISGTIIAAARCAG